MQECTMPNVQQQQQQHEQRHMFTIAIRCRSALQYHAALLVVGGTANSPHISWHTQTI